MPDPFDSLMPPYYGGAHAHRDPDFVRAAAWLRPAQEAQDGPVILGAPFSQTSISGARCDLLPLELRAALWSFSTFGRGADLGSLTVRDAGDVLFDRRTPEANLDLLRDVCAAIPGGPKIVLGGDNSITAPAFLATVGPDGGLITIDAHHDLRNYERDGVSNGSPVRVLLDKGLKGESIWQLGIADFANSSPYADYSVKSGINVVSRRSLAARGVMTAFEYALDSLRNTDGIYVDFDLDVVDRSQAPGAPASLPGGLDASDVFDLAFAAGRSKAVAGIDIVEVDPERDVAGVTVRLAALVLLNFLAGVAQRG